MYPLTRSEAYQNLTVFIAPEPVYPDIDTPVEIPERPPTPGPEITQIAVTILRAQSPLPSNQFGA